MRYGSRKSVEHVGAQTTGLSHKEILHSKDINDQNPYVQYVHMTEEKRSQLLFVS